MIKVSVIPTGTPSSANERLLVEISERVCKPYCILSTGRPSASVEFTVGNVSVLGGYAIAKILATVTIVTPSESGCGCAKTQIFTEQFEVAFTATTANTISVSSVSSKTEPDSVRCCKANAVKVTSTITVSIS